MNFANPSFLWALTGLLIPIAIHLLSRKEGKVVRVGSLRHVEQSNTSQFKSIRLNEVLLLLLRLLMVISIVLFLSGAQCSGSKDGAREQWLVVEPGVENNSDYKPQIDSLVQGGYSLHYLSDGFPTSNEGATSLSYWTFIEQLNRLPIDVVVIASSRAESFKGKRIALKEHIRWISTDPEPVNFVAAAWKVGDSVLVRNGHSDANETTYETKIERDLNSIAQNDSTVVQKFKPVVVSISGDKDDTEEIKILTGALNVLKKEYGLPIEIEAANSVTQNPDATKWIFWLSDAQPKMSGNNHVVFSTPGSGPFIERISANVLHLNRKMDRDVALEENLVIALIQTLFPETTQHSIFGSKDVRTMPDAFAWSNENSVLPEESSDPKKGIEGYMIMLFLVALAGERFVAIQRNQ